MRKVKLTELYNLEEGNIAGNPEIDVSGSMTHGAGEFDMNTTNNMSPFGPQGPSTAG